MRRLTLLLLTVLTITLVPSAASTDIPYERPARTGVASSQPNIVLITVDDMRADELRFMPNVRTLIGEQGFRFTRAYSTLPQCCPARASLLTGMYAHNHGVMSNYFSSGGGYRQFLRTVRQEDTLGVWLQRVGYRTSYIGKFLNGYAHKGISERPPGWNAWKALIGDMVYSYGQQQFNLNGRPWTSTTHNTQSITSLAMKRMKPGSHPFFVWMNYLAPHSGSLGDKGGAPRPLALDRRVAVPKLDVPNERHLDDKPTFVSTSKPLTDADHRIIQRKHAARVRSVIGVDRKVGLMIDHLESTDLLDDTIVVFHSDNGFLLGEHGIASGKNVPYEPATKVPLVISGPGIPVGVTSAMVTLQDVTATIIKSAGALPGSVVDGVALTRIIAREDSFRDRPVLYQAGPTFSNVSRGISTVRGERFFTAIHYRRWVYIRYHDGQQELYDLRRDRHQLHSLHDRPEFEQIRRLLRRELDRLEDCEGHGCNRRFSLAE